MESNQSAVTVESLDLEGRGIAHCEGKVIFIEGALPGEEVTFRSYRKKPSFEMAQAVDILKPSFLRIEPKCRHFGVCGGCSMQHLDSSAQVAAKQRVLEDTLLHVGKVKPEIMFPALYGTYWGYRQRARLSVRHVEKKGKTLVGFHEKRSSFVADMQRCEILPPKIGGMLAELAQLMDSLSIRDRLPQIEVACGDNVDVLVLRILEPLSTGDETALRQFADAHKVQFWLQTKGPDTASPFHPMDAPALTYSLPEFGVEMPFAPTEFTQVNHQLNRMMVHRTVRVLDPQPGERIADFFCGLGNFTLPIARGGAHVLGVEGSAALVKRALQGAEHNQLGANTQFMAINLFEMNTEELAKLGQFNKWLIDPPRDGAVELVKAITPETAPQRIVYVSCNPATLARDAAVLVQTKGYVLKAAGVMNMFPQTSHVESIALFEHA